MLSRRVMSTPPNTPPNDEQPDPQGGGGRAPRDPGRARPTVDEMNVMPLGDHLEDLRRRIILALLGVVPIFFIGMYFSRTVLNILVAPLMRELSAAEPGASMQVTSVFEGFNTWIKTALIITLAVGAPWIVYQAWKFVAPGLYLRERRFVHLLAPLSAFLTALGMAFFYFVILHIALNFFVHFNQTLLERPPPPGVVVPENVVLPQVPLLAGDPAEPVAGQMWVNQQTNQMRIATGTGEGKVKVWSLPMQGDSYVAQHYKVSEYLNMILTFGLAFAIAFQTPVVVLLLGWAGLVKEEWLRKYRKQAFLGCTLVGFFAAPPDALSMIAMMFTLYGLYEVGLLLLRIFPAERVAEGRMGRRRALPAPAEASPAAGAAPPVGAPGPDTSEDPYDRPDDR